MRFAPNSLDVVFVAGLGQHPPQPTVTVSRADGTSVAVAPGHDPGWVMPEQIAWCPPEDGMVQGAFIHDLFVMEGPHTTVAAGNSLTAAAGKVAVHRTDPRRVLTSWGISLHGHTDPVLSADGQWMATVLPDVPHEGTASLTVERADFAGVRTLRWTGPVTRPRFSHDGTSLCWEGGHGQIYGIADVANPSSPVVKLSRDGDKLYHPVPLWVPERVELFVLAVQDQGEGGVIMLAEWGSAAAHEPLGYVLVPSSGSAYDHDVCSASARYAEVALLTPDGLLRRVSADYFAAHEPLPLPPTPPVVEPPPVLPDQPFVVDPTGVVEDIALWLFSPNQGPDVHVSGDRQFFCKSDEVSGDGANQIGEWRDRDAHYIGHLEDSSAGQRVLNGKAVTPETLPPGLSPAAKAALWASLPLNRNWFSDDARLWLPRRCVSGYRVKYRTDIMWTTGYVQPNIEIEIRVDVGYGVVNGKPVRVLAAYIPGGNAEWSVYGEPNGYNAWVGFAAGKTDPWSQK